MTESGAVQHDAEAAVLAESGLGAAVTLESLLGEMTDPAAVARWPQPVYESLQASNYNRASTHRTQPDQDTRGWFADSDGTGFVRTETAQGRTEWVLLDHAGPGCITRLWAPFFYYGFDDRVGPNLRIYLDGAVAPAAASAFTFRSTGGEIASRSGRTSRR